MSDELRQDLYHKLLASPDDPDLLRRLLIAQARAIHKSRRHAEFGGYGRAAFEECGIRWCVAVRAIVRDPDTLKALSADIEPPDRVTIRERTMDALGEHLDCAWGDCIECRAALDALIDAVTKPKGRP